MIRRLWSPLAIAVFALAALSACRGMTPAESTQAAAKETRALITRHVSDPERAGKLIALVDALQSDLAAYRKKQAAHNKALAERSVDYDASCQDLELLYDALNRETRSIALKIARTHVEMQKLASAEEWKFISSPKHRIGGA